MTKDEIEILCRLLAKASGLFEQFELRLLKLDGPDVYADDMVDFCGIGAVNMDIAHDKIDELARILNASEDADPDTLEYQRVMTGVVKPGEWGA